MITPLDYSLRYALGTGSPKGMLYYIIIYIETLTHILSGFVPKAGHRNPVTRAAGKVSGEAVSQPGRECESSIGKTVWIWPRVGRPTLKVSPAEIAEVVFF